MCRVIVTRLLIIFSDRSFTLFVLLWAISLVCSIIPYLRWVVARLDLVRSWLRSIFPRLFSKIVMIRIITA
uniref:Uncharacterized protein n=1 Tax=Panstrongylus lignarius TaxID=156445 RepID=A0A224Y6I1_9HEMI